VGRKQSCLEVVAIFLRRIPLHIAVILVERKPLNGSSTVIRFCVLIFIICTMKQNYTRQLANNKFGYPDKHRSYIKEWVRLVIV